MKFNWDWATLIQTVTPVIISWLLGALGIGVPKLTPDRVMNKTDNTNTLR